MLPRGIFPGPNDSGVDPGHGSATEPGSVSTCRLDSSSSTVPVVSLGWQPTLRPKAQGRQASPSPLLAVCGAAVASDCGAGAGSGFTGFGGFGTGFFAVSNIPFANSMTWP